MNEETYTDQKVKTDIYHAPLGKCFDKMPTLFEVFICHQAITGLQLIASTGILTTSLLAGVAGFDKVSWPVAAED